jgi:tRNA(fMet)-specific endonuclease VapC
MDYLLDTNLLLIYLRQSSLKEKVEQQLQLFTSENTLLISVVSIGEIKSIATQNNWGDKRLEKLEMLLSKFLIVDINIRTIIEKYAEIDAFSQGKLKAKRVNFSARNMGKNDLWIAATASVLDVLLLSTDNDFEHLRNEYLKLRHIDIKMFG